VITNHQNVEDVYPGHYYTFFVRKDGSAYSFGYNNVSTFFFLNFFNRMANLEMEQKQQEVHQYQFLSMKTKIFQELLSELTTLCL
jgi:hypothetical protein